MAPAEAERTPRRVLVCPQEFKGSLTAAEAAAAIAEGVRRALPGVDIRLAPMADGGPGTAAIVADARGGRVVEHAVRGPLGASVAARYAVIERDAEPPLAVIESAAAAGLVLVPTERRDPTRATTTGVGELMRDAIARGAGELIVGVGGTGTNDGGAGLAQALGLRLLDRAGVALQPGGLHLAALDRIERPQPPPGTDVPSVRIAVDVQNPLLGAEGATAVYGAQKGLRDWQAPAMEAALARWAHCLHRDLGIDVASLPGAGAGGGTPAGILAAFPGAHIESGAALVAEAIGLAEQIADVDLVVTGEGAIDAQTAYGKAVAHVLATAQAAGVPCLAVAGVVRGRPAGLADAEPLVHTDDADAVAQAMPTAGPRTAEAAERLLHRWGAGG